MRKENNLLVLVFAVCGVICLGSLAMAQSYTATKVNNTMAILNSTDSTTVTLQPLKDLKAQYQAEKAELQAGKSELQTKQQRVNSLIDAKTAAIDAKSAQISDVAAKIQALKYAGVQ